MLIQVIIFIRQSLEVFVRKYQYKKQSYRREAGVEFIMFSVLLIPSLTGQLTSQNAYASF